MTLPTHTDEWIVESVSNHTSFALRLNRSTPIQSLGDDEVLLEIKAVSLNYRDLAIATGRYPLPTKLPLVPTSDAAGTILAVGASVKTLAVGDGVCVLPAPLLDSGHLTVATHRALGDGLSAGLLRRHVVLPASWVARFPEHLSFVEASSLGTAGVTAWNALFGSGSGAIAGGAGPRGLKAGDVVLTQGTGAVSMFAARFAVLTGATVIGTTSSESKKHHLTDLGVSKVLNYREDPNWGESARSFTKDSEGVDMVVDVGGPGTLGQSLKAVRYDGTIIVSGFLAAGDDQGPPMWEVLLRATNVRGVLAGSRAQYEEMAGKLEEWKFHPVIDKQIFGFGQAKEAYQYLWAQKHVGKVVIDVTQ